MQLIVKRILLLALAGMLLIGHAAGQNTSNLKELIEDGRLRQAEAIADKQLTTNGNDGDSLYAKAHIALSNDDLDRAIELSRKAIVANGQDADYRWVLCAALGSKAQKASMFSKMGLAREMKKELEAALQVDPKHYGNNELLMQYLAQAPGIVGGDEKRARQLPIELKAKDPVKGLRLQVKLLQMDKKFDEIPAVWNEVLKIDPKNYHGNLGLAQFYASDQQKKYADAERHARAAITAEPERASGYALLAQIFALEEKWAELDRLMPEAEKRLPNNLSASYQAGRVLLGSGKDLPRAERYFRKYLTVQPEYGAPSHGAANWRLALVLEKLGRKQEAVGLIEAAYRAEPKNKQIEADWKRMKG